MKKTILPALLLAVAVSAGAQEHYDRDSIGNIVYDTLKNDTLTDSDQWLERTLKTASEVVSNRHFANLYMRDLMMGQFFRSEFPGTRDIKDYVDNFCHYCNEDSLQTKIKSEYTLYVKKYGAIFPGQPAPDIEMVDTKGRVCRLSEMRGQLLFVDIWGTWCGPCIEEIPYLKALHEKYAADKRIKIMSLACDKTDTKWKAFLEKRKDDMTWAQYRVTTEGDHTLDSVYYVYGIPRFMLIDPKGIIIDTDAPRPSMEKYFMPWLEKEINKY